MKLCDYERVDDIGFANLRLIQRPEDFCYGADAVILAGFAAAGGGRARDGFYGGGTKIADLGTGTGIIPIILSHKTDCARLVGLEIQEDSCLRARRNAELNGLADRVKFVRGDVADCDIPRRLKAAGECAAFDAVTCNPPYTAAKGGLINETSAKYIARHETTGALEDFISCAASLLKDRGDLYMVHRPSRLVDIFCLCRKYGLEPKTLRLVSPEEGGVPNIALLQAVKNGGRELRLMPTLNIYNADRSYTEEIERIYERI